MVFEINGENMLLSIFFKHILAFKSCCISIAVTNMPICKWLIHIGIYL